MLSLPKRTDLHIIAKDNDYFASIPDSAPHEFLAAEYRERIGGTLHTYKSLTAFLQQHFKEYSDLAAMDIDLAVKGLHSSPTFRQTHREIEILSKYHDFTTAQVRLLVQAFLENKEVHGILADDDVATFAKMLWEKHRDKMVPAQQTAFSSLLEDSGLPIGLEQ